MKNKKIISILSCLLAVILSFSFVGCNKSSGGDSEPPTGPSTSVDDPSTSVDDPVTSFEGPVAPVESTETVEVKNATAAEITGGYEKGTARATQTSEYLGAVDKVVKPVKEVMDEHETYGVTQYPYYGRNLKTSTNNRDAIYWESISLLPQPTWRSRGIYNGIDAEGYLLKNGQRILANSDDVDEDDEDEEGEVISGGEDAGLEEGEEVVEGSTTVNEQFNKKYRMLYKHTASITMYGGGLSDKEPRIVKKITALTHAKLASTTITGLYAPAGEVIKIEIPEAEYKAAGGIAVYIGQNYNLDQQVAVEFTSSGVKGNGFTRMTDILSKFELRDKYKNVTIENGIATAYVGSFLGGPIYFRPINNSVERKVSVTISGAVRYQHFILGVTTPEEYEFNKSSTAPYFDLEVFDSVRFTTHKYASSNGLALKDFTYENCTDAAVLWDKIAEVSTRVKANGLSGASAPVYIIGDCYIAAGAAFANPGRNGVVCPPSWLAEALNYNHFVNSGSWGTMHEYNHCWQGYGLKNGGEVTNNATTLISYSLYTRISAGRTSATGWGNGGWNRFTDPSKSLGELLVNGRNGSAREDLSVYATLLHNIGQDKFIAAAKGGKDSGATTYFNNLVSATHLDMTYYFTSVLNLGVGTSRGVSQAAVDAAQAKNYPMFVPVSSVYQVGRSIIYDGKKEYITTAQPFSYGTGEFTMDFTNKNNFKGNSFASKALVVPDGFTVTVKSVTQPANGTVAKLDGNKVKYTPKSGAAYSGNFIVTLGITKDDEAFTVEDIDLVINLKQGIISTLYRTTYTYDEASSMPSSDAVYNEQTKTFDFGSYASTETRKNVCTQETNTQIWGSGRNYLDDTFDKTVSNTEGHYKALEVGKTIQTLDGVMYFSAANTYRFTLKGRGKGTLYLSYDKGATWEKAFTFDRNSGTAYVANEYYEHELTSNNSFVYFKVVLNVKNDWQDFFGIGVAAKQSNGSFSAFSDASAIAEASIDAKLEESKKFETDYHFESNYTYKYSGIENISASTMSLVSVNYESWDDTLLIANMFDGKADTYFHSKGGAENYITADKPLELVVDLGSVRKVNRVTFNGYKGDYKNKNNGMVKSFKLYGSKDGTNYTILTEQVDAVTNDARNKTYSFDAAEIKYYKLVVTKTDNGRYFAMNSIDFSYGIVFANGNMATPHDENVIYSGEWGTKNTLCDYGIIYTAEAGSSVSYTFTGTRVAYFAEKSSDYGTVDIYIDGVLVASDVSLSASNPNIQVSETLYNSFGESNAVKAGSLAYIYSGDALAQGEHVLKIVGKSGSFNVDAFAYWN
ncbi:MAG: hypothetical protein HDT28_03125 [Clostridiales bacterium]|nr:hypothetical protein [Clostridiales bacterium]